MKNVNGASILRVIFSNCMTLMDAYDKADEKDDSRRIKGQLMNSLFTFSCQSHCQPSLLSPHFQPVVSSNPPAESSSVEIKAPEFFHKKLRQKWRC